MPIVTEVQRNYQPDVIIVGGGASGCVIAGRLARARPSLEILVLEGGRSNLNDPEVVQLMRAAIHLNPAKESTKSYEGLPSDALGGRKPTIAVANLLGGGSSVNFGAYCRGSGSDYDDWKQPGWSCKELLPYFRRLESFYAGETSDESHGHSGPVSVSFGGFEGHSGSIRSDEMFRVAREDGYPVEVDTNDLKTANGFQLIACYLDPKTGHRQDAAHCYVHSYTGDNLKILCNAAVTSVHLEDGRATGVEYRLRSSDGFSEPVSIYASKLVVVTAGALATPAILERSGIGRPEVLRAAGITVQAPLLGVGENVRDHLWLAPHYRFTAGCENLNGFLQDTAWLAKEEKEFVENGKGMMASSPVLINAKLAPRTEGDFAAIGKKNAEFFRTNKDKPSMTLVLAAYNLAAPTAEQHGLLNHMGVGLMYPQSRGNIHISGASPDAVPVFRAGWLEDPTDLKMLAWNYRTADRLTMKMRCVVEKFAPSHPASDSQDDVEEWCKRNAMAQWHVLGSAKMGKPEEGGVVNERLEVHGVKDLVVCDLSVCPGMVGANTYNTALVVGEKAADLIAGRLGLSLGAQI